MKSQLTTQCLAAATLVMVGCGTSPSTGLQTVRSDQLNGQASATLRQGFEDVHKAIFDMIDRNKDGNVDEYEAGPYFNLRSEFPKADRSKAGVINYNEFMRYATKGGFLSPTDSPDRFLDRMRNFLDGTFKSFDTFPKTGWFSGGDGFLNPRELTRKAVSGAGLGFSYPRMHIDVKVKSFRRADFKEADKTGDGKLSQGEFEDLYMKTVVALIGKLGGKPKTPPAEPGTPPTEPTNPPAEPGNEPVKEPGKEPGKTPGNGGTTAGNTDTNNKTMVIIDSDDWDNWQDLL